MSGLNPFVEEQAARQLRQDRLREAEEYRLARQVEGNHAPSALGRLFRAAGRLVRNVASLVLVTRQSEAVPRNDVTQEA